MSASLPPLNAQGPHEETAVERTMGPCLANSRLEQLLAGHLSGAELVWAERHLARCPACNQRLLNLAGPIPTDRTILTAGETAPNPRTLGVLDQIAGASPFLSPLVSRMGSTASPAPPEDLAGFVDVSFVGRGGSGTVYRARQASLGRWVALKVLSIETTSRSITQAQRESQALASLNHPHVVTVYEAHLSQNPPFLVMEWVGGGSLQDRLQSGPLSIADATTLARQMAEAVTAVHALGLVHRDLKPANVLLAGPSAGEGGVVPGSAPLIAKITDFGLAQTEQSLTRTTLEGLAVGTPAFMAPEQTGLRLGLGRVGPACDIYGIGAVIFAALTGRPPHEGHNPMATLAHVAWEEVAWLRSLRSDVPVDLATIVAKCLRTQPTERYRSAVELRDDLERLARGEAIRARSYTSRERLRNWMRRHPTLAVAAGLGGTLLLALVLGVTYHLTQLRRTLADLQAEQQRVKIALERAEQATKAERHLRSETVRQVAMAHRVMLTSLQHTQAIASDNLGLLERIRRFYHIQVQSLSPSETELAEILGEGLSALCMIESWDLHNRQLAEEDSEMLLHLASEYPDSLSMLMNRVQVLSVRWAMFHQQERSSEADAALEEITHLAEQYASDPAGKSPPEFVPSLIAILWNAKDWPRALQVVEQALERARRQFPDESRPTEAWNQLLLLQSQRLGLLHQVERWADSEEALRQCLELSRRLSASDPQRERNLALQRLRLVGQHLQHAGSHLPDQRREELLQQGRDLFAALDLEEASLRDEALALIEWATTLESLPGRQVAAEELDSNWEVIQRHLDPNPPLEILNIFLPPLTDLRIRQARRMILAGQFATALQVARDCLDDLQILQARAALLYDRLCVELLAVAAEASHGLGRGSEELSYLSRAVDQAVGAERLRLQRQLAEVALSQGIAQPVEHSSLRKSSRIPEANPRHRPTVKLTDSD